jgi:hypothetical protein
MVVAISSSQPRGRDDAKGLATLALLKANFDSGRDHIEMFMPFVVDSIAMLRASDFSVEDLKSQLDSRHGLRIPTPTLRTILARAAKRGALRREGGRYFREASFRWSPDLASSREAAEVDQRRLAVGLLEFGRGSGVNVATEDDALALLLEFLARHHVGLILEADIASGAGELIGGRASALTSSEQRLVARFITQVVIRDRSFLNTLQRMLEGFVLQNTLLLRDISTARRRFSDLTVYFDTGFLLEALGLEGEAAGLAAREALDLLRDTGARLAVFDKTVNEIERILRVYEEKLRTSEGIASLYPTDLSRYVLTRRLSPSDIREQIALLESNLRGLGVNLRKIPPHDRRFTLDEGKLTEMIKKPSEPDLHPRPVHDVDCIAAVLTLRAGHSSQSYDNAMAVFATTTGVLVTNAREWFRNCGESGVPPVIHQLALSNIAWLKKPASASKLKLHELVALCSASLVPSPKVWDLFIKHLRGLRDSDRLSSDEMVAIVASELTDTLLSGFDEDMDVDADTIEDVIERVREQHRNEARSAIREAEDRLAGELAAASAARTKAEEEAKKREEDLRKMVLSIRSRSTKWARRISWGVFVVGAMGVVAGSSISLPELIGTRSVTARTAAYLISAFVWLLGIAGLLWGGYLSQWRGYLEARLERLLRGWLMGDGSEER